MEVGENTKWSLYSWDSLNCISWGEHTALLTRENSKLIDPVEDELSSHTPCVTGGIPKRDFQGWWPHFVGMGRGSSSGKCFCRP